MAWLSSIPPLHRERSFRVSELHCWRGSYRRFSNVKGGLLLMERKTLSRAGGMVATSQPAAVEAGLDRLRLGGTAADAAVAAAAVLCLVDPRSTGIGGDLFALYWKSGDPAPVALEGAGPAPKLLSVDAVRRAGYDKMPEDGPWSVTVPGSVAAWAALLERFGRFGLDSVLSPAITLGEKGFNVSRIVSEEWGTCIAKLGRNDSARPLFLPNGRSPKAGERFSNPDLASSLKTIAKCGVDAFYRGDFAARIADTVAAAGGPLRADDLAEWEGPSWTRPISQNYRGIDVYETPPPGQGMIVLQALALYDALQASTVNDQEHLAIESLKLAFADARAYLADPRLEDVPVEAMLSDTYISQRRSLIDRQNARDVSPGRPGDTVYVAVADGEGSGCALIQSLYEGFGSGIVVPTTGIALQNRGANFILDDEHPNRPAPGKRPYHTIIPAMLGQKGRFYGCLGVVGGFMQPQGQLQIIRNIVDRDMNPQAAINAPRWRVQEGRVVAMERGFSDAIASNLRSRGHEIQPLARFDAGGAQVILRSHDGYYVGGSDPRKDGIVGEC